MNVNDVFDLIIEDIKVKLNSEFDRNFERKAFFSEKWKPAKHPPRRGSLLLRTSALRKSVRGATREGLTLVWKSSKPYAAIHNEGGVIPRKSKRGKAYNITILRRQFVGNSPETKTIIDDLIRKNLPATLNDYFYNLFRNG